MKSLKKKLSKEQQPFNQSTPLIDQSPGSPLTGKAKSKPGFTSQTSRGSSHEDVTYGPYGSYSSPNSPIPKSPRSNSPNPMMFETAFQPSPKQEPSWVTEAREQCSKEPLLDSNELLFRLVEISVTESWMSGILQSFATMLLFVVLPSIVFTLGGLIFVRCVVFANLGRRTKSDREKRRVVYFGLIMAIILSVFKDSIIAVSIVNSLIDIKISNYEIIHANLFFFALLLFVVLPALIHEFTGLQFVYGNEDGDGIVKAKVGKAKKLAENFMKDNSHSIHEVQTLKGQAAFFIKYAPRLHAFLLFGSLFLVCLLRSLTPWMLSSVSKNILAEANLTNVKPWHQSNQSFVKATTDDVPNSKTVHDLMMLLSACNAFVVCLSLASLFIVAVLWNTLMLKMWRNFAEFVAAKSDLLSSGGDGINAWWRIYHTLRFYTWSRGSPSGQLRLFLNGLFTIAVIVISMFLMEQKRFEEKNSTTNVLLVIDNVLLLLGLIMDWIVSLFVMASQGSMLRDLGLKRLNMAQQIGKVSASSESDKFEGEYQVHLKRFKNRNLRTSLQLLQEIQPILKDFETGAISLVYPIILLGVFILGAMSSVKTIIALC